MEEISIKGNEGVIRFDHYNKTDILRVTAVDDKGHADSHHIFNQGTMSNCCCLAIFEQDDIQSSIPIELKFIHANMTSHFLHRFRESQ
ncbi:MAG: hypothetical protein IJL54_03980 [Prevotella sp.]|nr:hypothetical protein [Prevotella sp.]